MRQTEIGIFHMHQEISPEAIKAQRMAELRDIAEYRARHLKAVMDWSDPVKRATIIDRNEREIRHAQELVEGTTRHLPPRLSLDDLVGVVPVVKPAPKRSWLARLIAWMS